MLPYEIVEHTADIGIRARGATEGELFTHMAQGMFSLIVPLEQIRLRDSVEVRAQASDWEHLLIVWLKELLFLFDTKHLLGRDFKITRLEPCLIEATVSGETLDLQVHQVDKEVKAVTYCDFFLRQDPDGIYRAQVIFDI